MTLLLALALPVSACKSSERPYRGPGETASAVKTGTPLSFELKAKTTYATVAVEKSRPELEVEGLVRDTGSYTMTLNKFPKGTKWSVNGKQGTIASDIYEQIDAGDMAELMGELDLSGELLKVRFDPKLSATLELPDGSKGDAPLPPSGVKLSIPAILARVEKGPLMFKGEPPDDPKKKALVVVWSNSNVTLLGDKVPLNQVDKIAVIHVPKEAKGEQSCSYTSRTLKMVLKETESVVYDRRTGKELDRKRFAPHRVCPELVYVQGKQDAIDSQMPQSAIEAYLKVQASR